MKGSRSAVAAVTIITAEEIGRYLGEVFRAPGCASRVPARGLRGTGVRSRRPSTRRQRPAVCVAQ